MLNTADDISRITLAPAQVAVLPSYSSSRNT